ncbi:DUF3352 domain-containing protein [Dendronalium sp. ChiSLP03b]|uniref:DUF3352 domain-containing protein n=1 Tax=Dendronalium sp. ChiSLP03b TaxID=3075381 RepID=UPI002AD2D543|nr:DUF3352 domain-containing protein [Dendronalium sp. ChiSLP03b]MDZ8203394.1 DUF3352 domain-containing protein [Dendronalium sp. ChiSLP03b]
MILPVATLSLLSALTVAPVPEMSQPSPSQTPAVTNILPANTPLVGLINTKGKTWATLNRFYLFQTASKAVSQFLPSLFELDYAKDIESWLGEQVAFAFLPKVGSAPVSIDSNFLILAPVKDETRLQPLLEKLKADTSRVKEREYKGITILELNAPEVAPPRNTLPSSVRRLKLSSKPNLVKPGLPKKKRGIAIATLPGYVVTSITAQAIEQLIDASEGSTTLAQNPQFQETLKQSQSDGVLFTFYENLATLIPLISDISKDPNLPFPVFGADTIDLEEVKEYGSVNGFVTTQPEGLRLQVSAYRQALKSKQSKIVTKKTGTMLDRMPGATYSALTGRNLNQQWQQLAKGFSTKPQLKEYLEMFRNFVRTSTGLDWDKDILGWMDGEYGFFLFPTKGGLFKFVAGSNFNMGIGVAVQTSNRTAADATLKKLDELIQSFLMGGVVVNTHNIQGQPVTSWDIGGDSSQSLLAYSWVDDNTVIVTTGFGAIADLVPQPYILLPSTYNFQTATNSLPSPNHGYFYVNTGSFLSWLYGFLPTVFNDQNFQPWKQIIGSVYSISATTSTTAEREQFDILLVLAPSRKE